jgi:hypothetical protein
MALFQVKYHIRIWRQEVFCMAFLWLYPGGYVDFVESRVDCKEWAYHQLYLADGRFAKNKIWCFYVMNYVERRINQTQGLWCV